MTIFSLSGRLAVPAVAALAVTGVLMMTGATQTPASAADLTRSEVETIVREYLLANPEILNEMITALERKENVTAIKANRGALDNDGFSFVAGNPNGNVTIVEFFDYNCGFCRRARPDVLQLLEQDGNVRLVLKEFPILGPDSLDVSKVAMAAQMQGGDYWSFHNKLFSHDGRLDGTTALEIAGQSGYDVARIQTDMARPEIEERLTQTQRVARALAIDGTPSFVIGDRVIGGARSLDDLKAMIAEARAKCETC